MKNSTSRRDGNAFQLETVEPRILFSASLSMPVVELSSGDSSEHVALLSVADSTAHASAYAANGEQYSQEPAEVVIIDAATPDLEALVDSLENQSNDRLDVHVLDAGRDGIEQISEILAQYDNVSALHLISHGADGELTLGNSAVVLTDLLIRANDIAAWQDSFTTEADLLIYGCDLASSDAGRNFAMTLGDLTGTDVAASDDLTGSALLGGDWDLEFRTGSIETKIALDDVVQGSWAGVLSATIDTSSSGSTTGSILTVSHTTSGSERLMIVGISMDAQTSSSVSSVTYNGSSLTLVGVKQATSSNTRIEMWQMVAPTSGTHDVTVTFSQAMAGGGIAGVMTFNGVDQTTPLGSFLAANGAGNTALLTNINAAAGELIFSTVSVDKSASAPINEGAGQTEHWEIFQVATEGAGSTKVATSTSETVTWTVSNNKWAIGAVAIKNSTNNAPTFDSVPVTTATEDSAYSYGISASDVDGDPLIITATTLPTWLTLTDNGNGNGTAALTGTPTNADVGSHSVVLEVTDGTISTTQSFSIVVANVNDAPIFTSASSFSVDENTTAVGTVVTSDVDGGARQYTLAGGTDDGLFSVDINTGVLSFNSAPDFETPTDAGADNTYNVTVQANDGNGGITTQNMAITVADVNEAPTFDSAPVTVASEDTAYGYGISTSDVDGDPLTITASTLPAWLTLTDNGNGTASLTGTPTNADVGSHSVVLEVTDGTISTTQSFSIVVANVNDAPTFTSPVAFSVSENTFSITTLTSTDADGDVPAYSLINSTGASRFSIDSNTGEVRFLIPPDFENPEDRDADNTYDLTVQVSDGNGGVATQAIVVTVTNVNEKSVFSSPNSFTIAENTNTVTTITSADDSGSAQRYSLVGTEDDKLFSIDATTGVLSFIAAPNFESPLDTGKNNTYNLIVQVDDGTGLMSTLDVSVAIKNVNEAPTLIATEISSTEGFIGDIGRISMIDPDAGDELTLSITGGSAQAFFSVDPTSGTINQQSSLSPGVYTIEVQLSDANGMSTNAVLQIRIVAEPDLGAATNEEDNTETYPESSSTTAESGYTQIEQGTNSTALPDLDAIVEHDNTSRSVVAESSGESRVAANSDPSAMSDRINTLFAASPIETTDTATVPQASETNNDSIQSRGYSVVLELLLSKAANAFDEFDSALDAAPFSITLSPYLLGTLSSTPADVDEQKAKERIEFIHTAGTVATISLTVGFVSWFLTTGSLMATAMSTSPLWRGVDPVAVLGQDSTRQQ